MKHGFSVRFVCGEPSVENQCGGGGGGLENPFCACVAGTALLTLFVLFVLVVVVVMLQNRQVMVTSFGCCWCSGDTPQSPDCWSSCNVWGR